ncbi:MAG TPA: hypothetical protein VMV53_11440 [Acidimicrobiales bacterium]|nr:hypothetical protein [Acidimicrobiales bacterium]
MDDEATQARRVAEAARRLREHEHTILEALRGGDFVRQEYDDRTWTLRCELDEEITKWRAFDR